MNETQIFAQIADKGLPFLLLAIAVWYFWSEKKNRDRKDEDKMTKEGLEKEKLQAKIEALEGKFSEMHAESLKNTTLLLQLVEKNTKVIADNTEAMREHKAITEEYSDILAQLITQLDGNGNSPPIRRRKSSVAKP